MDDILDQLQLILSTTTIPTRIRPNVSHARVRSIVFGQVFEPYRKRILQPSV